MRVSSITTSILLIAFMAFCAPVACGSDGAELPVPANLKLSLEILSPISTATNKKGDKFSCKVLTPAEYAGAIVEGHIRNLKRSGKANKDSNIDLAFEKLTLADGRSADFSATVIEVFDVVNAGGEGRADNEGTVRNKSTTVKTSVKRAAAGALIGGLIGAVVAGGQGAAIGAAIGAGVGVTTTLATKGPDLEFKEGTQFTVESNGPVRKKKEQTSSQTSPTPDHPLGDQPTNGAAPDPPSGKYRSYSGNNLFTVSIPDNWRNYASETSVVFAPERGYVVVQGRPDFTRAVMIGTLHAQAGSLEGAAAEYVDAMLKGNSYLKREGDPEKVSVAGHDAIKTLLSGTSNSTKRTEHVIIINLLLSGGSLFYVDMIVPADESVAYEPAFQTILKSIEIHNQ